MRYKFLIRPVTLTLVYICVGALYILRAHLGPFGRFLEENYLLMALAFGVLFLAANWVLAPRRSMIIFPDAKTIRERARNFNDEEKASIDGLWSQREWKTLSRDDVETVATLVHLAANTPIKELGSRFIISQHFDSLDSVELVMCLEDLLVMDVPDSNILTFNDLLKALDSSVRTKVA